MKRIFSFIITILLALNMGISSVAFANEEERIADSEAVSVVTAFNIMNYYDDGTFRPNETVTRAEMAAIICRMLNYEKPAQSNMGLTVFYDISEEHWASGYINVIQSLLIVGGYGDGNFGPEDNVTYEQAVKMIMNALGGGNQLYAICNGGYPAGYLKLAEEEGILKNTEYNVGCAIDRETVATLVFNAMEVPIAFDEVYMPRDDNYPIKTGETILSRHWEMRKWGGILEKDEAKYILKNSECFEYQYGGELMTKVEEPLGEIDFDRIENIEQFAGQEVNVYISRYADETTEKHVAYAVTINSK